MNGIIDLAAVALPLVALGTMVLRRRPGVRRSGAAGLATLLAFSGILVLNGAADLFGWWAFAPLRGAIAGQPLALIFSWAVLWGAIPTLAPRLPIPMLVAGLAVVDVVAMPMLTGVVLGGSWLVGEAAGLLLVAWPAIVIGRLTAERQDLGRRVLLQVYMAALVLMVATPLIAVGDARALLAAATQPNPVRWLATQLLMVGSLLGVAAVRELFLRGQGTPWPWDPPVRVVTSGPYRYVSNPMQLAAVLIFLAEALWLRSWVMLIAAAFAAAFSAVNAQRHEESTAGVRYGEAWTRYHASVRPWVPTLRPAPPPEPATLWVAGTCEECDAMGAWVARRSPVGLVVQHAETRAAGVPTRAMYEDADGHAAYGSSALAYAMEHFSIGWALTGWLLRMPSVSTVAIAIGDSFGFGPKTLSAATSHTDTTQEGAGCQIPIPATSA